jgi:hypothetical protein
MSKLFIIQISLAFVVLAIVLVAFRAQIFEPSYKDYLVRTLYPSANERKKIGIRLSKGMQDRVTFHRINFMHVFIYMGF